MLKDYAIISILRGYNSISWLWEKPGYFEDLIETGVDVYNPLEAKAGMDQLS